MGILISRFVCINVCWYKFLVDDYSNCFSKSLSALRQIIPFSGPSFCEGKVRVTSHINHFFRTELH